MRIFITGDTHRFFERVWDFTDKAETSKDDVLVILGDAGINYFGEPKDRILKSYLTDLPLTLFCIHGNHEMRPVSIIGYEETQQFGGIAYTEELFPNIIFAKDGEIYDLGGKSCIAIGGAYSIDKEYRLENNAGWWSDEQPDDKIKTHVESRLNSRDWKIDVVFSHTCPQNYIPHEAFLKGIDIDQSKVDRSTEIWLDEIENKLSYERWYCGHWHINKLINNMRFVFEDVIML